METTVAAAAEPGPSSTSPPAATASTTAAASAPASIAVHRPSKTITITKVNSSGIITSKVATSGAVGAPTSAPTAMSSNATVAAHAEVPQISTLVTQTLDVSSGKSIVVPTVQPEAVAMTTTQTVVMRLNENGMLQLVPSADLAASNSTAPKLIFVPTGGLLPATTTLASVSADAAMPQADAKVPAAEAISKSDQKQQLNSETSATPSAATTPDEDIAESTSKPSEVTAPNSSTPIAAAEQTSQKTKVLIIETSANCKQVPSPMPTKPSILAPPGSAENMRKMLKWDENGVGTMPGSALRFRQKDDGGIETLWDEYHENRESQQRQKKAELPSGQAKCQGCGSAQPKNKLVRDRFCSQQCAIKASDRIRSMASSKSLLNGDHRGTKGHPPVLNVPRITTSKSNSAGSSLLKPQQPVPSPTGARKRKQNLTPIIPPTPPGSSKVGKRRLVVDSASASNSPLPPEDSDIDYDAPSSRAVSPAPSSTKLVSRPSSPLSSSPHSALQQSILAQRATQQLNPDWPHNWDRSARLLCPSINGCQATDVIQWPAEKVADFIGQIPGCRDYCPSFIEQMVDGEAFLLLNQQDLVTVLNIKLGPAVKIYNSIIRLREAL